MCFDRGTFGVRPLTYFYIPKSARAHLFPQSVKINRFCSFAAAPSVLTPFVRNQGHHRDQQDAQDAGGRGGVRPREEGDLRGGPREGHQGRAGLLEHLKDNKGKVIYEHIYIYIYMYKQNRTNDNNNKKNVYIYIYIHYYNEKRTKKRCSPAPMTRTTTRWSG